MTYRYILNVTTDLLKYTSQMDYLKEFLVLIFIVTLCIISYVKVCFYNFYENKKKIEGN